MKNCLKASLAIILWVYLLLSAASEVRAFPGPFWTTVPHVDAVASTNSTYHTNLIYWWSMDEASGSRLSWTNGGTLSDNNTVTSAAGVVTNAADFELSTSEFLSRNNEDNLRAASNCTFVCFVNLESDGADRHLVSKGTGNAAANFEYWCFYDSATDDFIWQVSNQTTANSVTTAGTFNAGTFHFVAFGLSNSIPWIRINTSTRVTGTAINTNAVTAGIFRVGSNPANTVYWDGLVDELIWFKNRVLTDAELNHLRNGGAGRPYPGN